MSNCKLTTLLFVVLALAVQSFTATAQPTIQLQPFLSGLSSPVFITNAKDDTNRLFVVEQGGIIKVFQPGSTASANFINITPRVSSGGERGLLGLAFHPQFAANGKFYVYYTCNNTFSAQNCPTTGDTIVSEFTLIAGNPNQGDPNTERILLKIPQPFSNHNGGMIEFGPDGYLYIGMGDGGSGNDPGNRSQNRSLLLGKMVRIDVTPSGSNPYTIPPTNPYTGAGTSRCDNGSAPTGTTCQEIYAVGLRNPFRWSFDRGGTRQLYAGDVGQGALEELSIVTLGGNMGWRVYEGTQCTGLDPNNCSTGTNPIPHVPPFFEYFNSGSPRCSVTGGYVYRGRRNALPVGTYVFSDYCTGEIMLTSNTPRTPIVLLDPALNVASFGEDEAGELYVVGLGGTIDKIVNPNAVTPSNIGADFDGDLRTVISVFRQSNGTWYILNSFNGTTRSASFGLGTDTLVPGDYDGDGKTDIAVFRNGNWFSLDSSNNAFRSFTFGTTGDVPYAGDYDGDRKTDYAVYRQSTNSWYIWQSSNSQLVSFIWGLSTDNRVPADYDGDGRTDLAVWRPSSGTWFVRQSSNGNSVAAQWGASGDVLVPGDYDGDLKADFAVWRPSNGFWYALQSSNSSVYSKQWGGTGDSPVAGDYDGDGKTDPAVTRGTGGAKTWYITRSSNAFTNRSVQFGADTDANVPTSDVP